MSWSISKSGDAHEIAGTIDEHLPHKCIEPEEGVRLAALDVVRTALRSQSGGVNVIMNASGHQSKDYTSGKVSTTLRIEVLPQ